MEIKKGISVSPGVVIGTALVLDAEDLLIPKRFIALDQTEAEVERLQSAIASAATELARLRDTITAEHGRDIGSIFDFHLALLRDKSLVGQFYTEIRDHHTTAEYAVSVVMRRYAGTVSAIKDKYLSERVKDIHDIEKRVLRLLIGQKHEDLGHLTQDVVVIAHDLLP
ncbi:MAG: ptsI, partial [Phycisphaerales bacterium]|nr:ptsI [Phycisphaerales bacterium]